MGTQENVSSVLNTLELFLFYRCVEGSEYTKLSTAASWSWIKAPKRQGAQLGWTLSSRLFTTGVKPGENEVNATVRQMYQLVVIIYQLCTFPVCWALESRDDQVTETLPSTSKHSSNVTFVY